MATVGAPVSSVDVAGLSPSSLLRAWARPAGVGGLLIAVLFLTSPFAGGTVAIAGIAYLATSLLIVVGLIMGRRAEEQRRRPPVVILTAAWTSAWVLGVVTFGLVALLLGALDADAGTRTEGFVISPVFWLLSFPIYVIFLVAALVARPHQGRRRRRRGSAAG